MIWIILILLVPFSASATTQEVCNYQGSGSYSSDIHIQTRVSRDSQTRTVQTTLTFNGSFLFVSFGYELDEISVFSGGHVQTLYSNARQTLNGSIKRQRWDRFDMNWQTHLAMGWRIQGTNEAQFKGQYPIFQTHWPLDQFGLPWADDFAKEVVAGRAERRTDLDVKSINDSTVSPAFLAFYQTRFLDPSASQQFQVVTDGNKMGTSLPVTLTPQKTSDNLVTWETPIHLGDIESPANQPAQIQVNPITHQLQQVNLVLENDQISVSGRVNLQGCQ